MTDYRGFRITDIHAICAIGDDDEEGVCAYVDKFGATPLISADPKRLSQITEMAQQIADQTGRSFKVVRFSVREEIGEIKPSRGAQ